MEADILKADYSDPRKAKTNIIKVFEDWEKHEQESAQTRYRRRHALYHVGQGQENQDYVSGQLELQPVGKVPEGSLGERFGGV